MAASSEVRFKIGADTSALSRAFTTAETIAAAAGKQIGKKFGLQDAFKSSFVTLGLSIENVAEKIAALWTGGDPEKWKTALDAANDSARIIEESTLRRMSTVRQIAELEKKIARNAAQEDAAPKQKKDGFFATGAAMFSKVGFTPGASLFKAMSHEDEAEAAARATIATRERLAAEAKIIELKEKELKNTERIADARRELARSDLSDQGKIAAANEDALMAEERLEDAKRKGAETAELELELIAKIKRYREAITEEAKALAEFRKKEAEDERAGEAKAQEAAEKLSEERGKANVDVNDADQANQTAKRDALAFTIDEAAGGKRGNNSDRSRAKAIRRDEATARRLFDSGNTVTQFDFKTGKNAQRGADFFQDRALQLRGEFSKTKSNEQTPFAGTEQRLDEAVRQLRELNEKLRPTNAGAKK
jgi:hypothetical protein